MLVRFIGSVFLFVVVFNFASCQTALRSYVIRRDLFHGIKASEYSVYDETEQKLLYRMETKLSLLQKLELFSYPSKTLVGRLNAQIRLFLYKGNFTLFDQKKNQWASGEMRRNFQWLGGSFSIYWKNANISLNVDPLSLKHVFLDSQGTLLADFTIRISSIFWARKYDMKIYQNTFPDELYMLGLAGEQRQTKNSKGWTSHRFHKERKLWNLFTHFL